MKKRVKTTYVLEQADKKYFKIRCEYLSITRVWVSKQLGITNCYLNYILNGERPIGEELLQKFRDLGFSFLED